MESGPIEKVWKGLWKGSAKLVHEKADFVKALNAAQRFLLRWAMPRVRIIALPRDRAIFVLQQVKCQPASPAKMVSLDQGKEW